MDETLLAELRRVLGDRILSHESDDVPTIEIASADLYDVVDALYKDEKLAFRFLTTLFGMHHPPAGSDSGGDLGLQVLLYNMRTGQRLRVTCRFPIDNPVVKSLTPIFPTANWMEREAWDFYGIRFEGHPNLKRILNLETMTVFPMRKDFPLEDLSREDKDDRMFGR